MYGNKKSLTGNGLVRSACILVAFYTMPAAADLAASKLATEMQNESGIRANNTLDTQLIDNNGREQKATSAQDKSNTGQTIAAVAGAALISTGSAMIPSIIPSVSAAGAALVAKGVQELVQAAADGSAAGQNGAQKDMLLNNSDGTSPTNNVAVPGDLANLLSNAGVNPESFVQGVANGQIQTGNDVLKALGKQQVSGDDLTAADNLANSKLTSTLAAAAPGAPAGTTTTLDESAKAGNSSVDGAPGAGGGGGGGTLSENTHGDKGQGADANGNPMDAGSAAAQAQAQGAGGAAGGASAGAGGLQGLMADMGLGGLLGEEGAAAPGKPGVTRAQLLSLGVLPPQPKQNLFQIAHRNYRSFQKWRQSKKQRLAQK